MCIRDRQRRVRSGGSGVRQPPGKAQETRRKRYYPFVATRLASTEWIWLNLDLSSVASVATNVSTAL
eukprot:2597495-Alexandrium_andersonii.AAC.1